MTCTRVLLLVLLAGCGSAPASELTPGRFELFVLGRAQDGGLPHFGCDGQCCEEARRTGHIEHPACLGVHDRHSGKLLLIEATPGVEAQVALLHELTGTTGRGRQPVDGVLLTHAHIGHYLGLAHFGREVAATTALPVHCTERMAAFLSGHGPWQQLVTLGQITLFEHGLGERFEPLPGLFVEAVRVPHRDEFSDTVAFRIFGPRQSVLFVPDVDRWDDHPGLLERLLDGIDVAYLDGTFYDGRELPERNLEEIPHPPMVRTMVLLEEQARQRPGSLRFIHLNHTNPAFRDPDVLRRIAERGFRIAQVGERIAL